MKKIWSFSIALTISICIALLFGEAVTRMFFPQEQAMRWLQGNERYGSTLTKNFHDQHSFPGSDFVMEVKINHLGLRDQEYDISNFADPSVKKILLLGDSFTFGHGVNMEETFDHQLEELLRNDGNFLVLNAGVGGWGTLQETTYARDHLRVFNPDIIVLTFCGNDPSDDVFFLNGFKNSDKGILGDFPAKRLMREHSHFYRFLYKNFRIAFHNWLLKKKLAEYAQDELDTQSASFITEAEWQRTFQYIRSFHADFLELNPNGILLVQATAPWLPSIREHLHTLSNGIDLIYVDLYDDAIVLPPQQRKLSYDRHWSREMHAISAKNLYRALRAKLAFDSGDRPDRQVTERKPRF